MRYIDKSKPEAKYDAYAIIRAYIDSKWSGTTYSNLNYRSFRRNTSNKTRFRKLLLKEQDHYCCYCMKHILENETTLEHIVPNGATDPLVFDEYVTYGQIRSNVFLWDEDRMSSTRITPPPFPHVLAYENLVASCNGFIPIEGLSKCCNNKRGSEKIIPTFYINNDNGEFQYDVRGMIVCDAKYNDTINTLALEHTTLQLFRRCWLNLPSKYSALDVIDASTNVDLRKQIIDDMDFLNVSISDRTTIVNNVYWTSFMNYFWFYLYKQGKGY